jgi:hypothetical protein
MRPPVFWVQDIEGHPYEVSRLPRLRQMIDKTLKGEVVAREALKDRDKIKKREREFRFPDPYHLRQRRLGNLHHHRGRHPRPPRPAV